ncbi:HM20A-like protein [Mya arenaria]|uniref:HM20A-like protein n=1 Tax=Mya arenaria TaxID=6604 RepID=A0ABY7FJN0_MYAAR|nr:HM20A-like protein [Mya arenaria]
MNRLRISKGGREFLMPLTSNTSSNQTLSVLNSTTCTDGTSEISSNVTVDSSSQDGGDLNRSVDSTIATDINLGTLDDMSAVNLTGVKSGNLASGEPGNLAETESEKLNFEDAHGYIVATTGGLNIVSSGDAGNDKQEAPSDLTEVVTLDSTSSLNHGDTEQSLHQNQVDGVLSNSSTILLPENLVLFETSKGYVIFAVKRRQEMKTERPDLTFPEITKHMGQEWSNFTEEEKDKYMRLAEEDKQRYITEMKEFQESDQYQQFVRNKRQAGGMLNGLSQNDKPLIDIDDNIGEELYCRLCNQFFISAHNKREHMFGRQHLQNITNEIRKDIQEQEDTQKQQLLMAADDLDPYTLPEQTVVTLETDDLHSDNSASLDIDDFIHKFWEKNAYREKEVHTLKKANRSFADDNLLMTKQIKELEELETKLTHDLGSLKAYGSSLSAQVDSLKMVPTLFGVINF